MISILLWCVLSLISTIHAQQPQVVYEQHFPQQQQSPQQNYNPPQHLQYQQQPLPQHQPQVAQYPQQYNYAPPQPQHFVVEHQQQYPVNNVGSSQDHFLPHQPIPMFQAMPAPAPAQQQPLTSDNNGGFMQRMGLVPPGPMGQNHHHQQQSFSNNNHNHHHMMNGQGMHPQGPHPEFAARRGPPPHGKRRGKPPPKQRFNAILRKRKPTADMGPPIKMMDMNRIPKPPKYPLYDMGSLSMATPPPPPVMHPMAQVPSNNYATFVKSPNAREGRPPGPPPRGKPPRGRRPPKKHRGRRPPPPPNHVSRPQNRKHGHPGDKKHVVSHGFDHPMASNLDPLMDSPSLGRPLSYDEYMERPSHSFTNDPWNFDPYASKYNSGMNTYAMKYNYDPLGMNSLDKSQSHLDPNKLSYPGDYYTQDGSATPGADSGPVRSSQIGGWDQAPETYRTPETDMIPPPKPGRKSQKHSSSNPHRSQSQNSFNVYEDNADEASSVIGSETHLNPLKMLADANPGMEFSIESADLPSGDSDAHASKNSYSNLEDSTSFYTQQLHNVDPISQDSPWAAYPQTQSPYQDSGTAYSEQSSIMRQDNVIFEPPQPSQQSHYQQYNTNPNQPPPPQQQNHYYQHNQQPNSFQQPQQQQQQQQSFPHQTSPSRHDYENAPSPHTYDDEVQMNRRKEDYAVHEQPYSNLSDNYSPGGPGDGLNIDIMPPHPNAPSSFKKRIGLRNRRQEAGTSMVNLEGLRLFQDILNNKNAIGARNHLLRIL